MGLEFSRHKILYLVIQLPQPVVQRHSVSFASFLVNAHTFLVHMLVDRLTVHHLFGVHTPHARLTEQLPTFLGNPQCHIAICCVVICRTLMSQMLPPLLVTQQHTGHESQTLGKVRM